ncbi:MAG: hypothetical protein IKL80_02285, partial [Clostridia bacterium]|nr:hypothetical protein [Clostridia bacterium]
ILCFCLLAASSVLTFAADREKREPDIFIQGRKIILMDQNAYITDEGRTLVPARGVFEYMGCTVDWNAEAREVSVVAKDETKVLLTIDSDKMVVTAGEETKEQTLDCPATLMNDRTMIPLRAVSLALGATIVWNPDAYAIYITPRQTISSEEFQAIISKYLPQPEPQPEIVIPEFKEEEKLIVSLSTDAKEIKAGDEFDVYVTIDNSQPGYKFEGVVATVKYDPAKVAYIENSASLLDEAGAKTEGFLTGENVEYKPGLRFLFLVDENRELPKEGANVVVMRFKALADSGIELALNNDLDEDELNETYLVVELPDGNLLDLYGDRLIVTEEALKIN